MTPLEAISGITLIGYFIFLFLSAREDLKTNYIEKKYIYITFILALGYALMNGLFFNIMILFPACFFICILLERLNEMGEADKYILSSYFLMFGFTEHIYIFISSYLLLLVFYYINKIRLGEKIDLRDQVPLLPSIFIASLCCLVL